MVWIHIFGNTDDGGISGFGRAFPPTLSLSNQRHKYHENYLEINDRDFSKGQRPEACLPEHMPGRLARGPETHF